MSGLHLDQLPRVYAALFPDLATLPWPVEERAPCAACPMAPGPDADERLPRWFPARQRCCTYWPTLPNFLVGRLLRGGGAGRARVLGRVAQAGGRSPYSLGPHDEWRRDYQAHRSAGFGRDVRFGCPYWEAATATCAIWADRDCVCRTWFCKHVHGPRGRRAWLALTRALRWVEESLARHCVAAGTPPAGDAPTDAWVAWFEGCAARIDTLAAETPLEPRFPQFAKLAAAVRDAVAERDAAMPDVLAPAVLEWEEHGDTATLVASTVFDSLDVPRAVFVLFSKMDGTKPWRAALAEAEQETGQPLGEALVHTLFAHGSLSAPDAPAEANDPAATRVELLPGGEDGDDGPTFVIRAQGDPEAWAEEWLRP